MSNVSVPSEIIENKIFLIRGQKVMLDKHLAELYGVETKNLNKAVKRNINRFPVDFMFQLTGAETASLRFQFGTSKKGRGGERYAPFVFTEQGVAMLSSVLHSPRAVQVNIAIMRAFVKLRELMISHKDLARKIEEVEQKVGRHDENFVLIFNAIRQLMEGAKEPRKKKLPIGFHTK